jgi:flagellar motor switch protein FliN
MTNITDSPVAQATPTGGAGVSSNVPAESEQNPAVNPAPAPGAAAGDAGMEIPEIIAANGAAQSDVSCDKALDMLGDVELDVKVELGRCQMFVGDVLHLQEGDVVELDKLAGDPVDVYVNDRLVARGEVLVVNENFCVRVNQIVAKED